PTDEAVFDYPPLFFMQTRRRINAIENGFSTDRAPIFVPVLNHQQIAAAEPKTRFTAQNLHSTPKVNKAYCPMTRGPYGNISISSLRSAENGDHRNYCGSYRFALRYFFDVHFLPLSGNFPVPKSSMS